MLREKWTWVATGLIATLALTLLSLNENGRLRERVEKLERYVPYLKPVGE